MSSPSHQALELQQIVQQVPKVTAVINSGAGKHQAGLQLREDGRFLFAHVLSSASGKTPFRFCVGDPTARSSVWRVFAGRNASDVYIAIRSSASLHKISLHESGDFRYQLIGMTQDEVNRPDFAIVTLSDEDDKDSGRILHQWTRPESSPEGWTEGFRLIIPGDDLMPGPAGKKDLGDVEWIPAPSDGRAVEVRGYFVDPGMGEMDLSSLVGEVGIFSFLGGFKLKNEQVFVVFSSTVTLLEWELETLKEMREKGRANAHPEFDWSKEKGSRILAYPSDETGFPTFIDAKA
ncbi:hypothetical protein ARTHRO9V_1640056 [Arthrobacter sp. 9V]|uniref:hypothetical protein n=1 Tax=Arthrobacter sp. 9V TaxID=2653132 RepID=UPI0012F0F79D|nr:hypothetical protein [Arthrobacter sp. 9V]VXB67451.1 hypothetical protein ARTHRO9V_1640056 [Arthrobacter sp. 9V]